MLYLHQVAVRPEKFYFRFQLNKQLKIQNLLACQHKSNKTNRKKLKIIPNHKLMAAMTQKIVIIE